MTEIDKNAVPSKLLWVDLEMTGLDTTKDVIIEVAAIVTDFDFKTLATYEALVAQPEDKLTSMNPWAQAQHDGSGLTDRVRREGRPEADVTRELSQLIQTQFGAEPAILAGNSIHNDRQFIRSWWPDVEALLHYRMLDVSSWKIFMQAAHGLQFDKMESHRALGDIQASIAELEYYLEWFKDHGQA
ncbi:MAG: oligoribonuclease [Candidatus Saccharimonadales bacterium]